MFHAVFSVQSILRLGRFRRLNSRVGEAENERINGKAAAAHVPM